jgi:hypothetical protein
VIAHLVAAAEQVKLMMEPSSIVSAMKNIAQISGYYRHDGGQRAELTDGQSVVQTNFLAMTDAQLTETILAGAAA